MGKYGEHKEVLVQPEELPSKPTTGTAPKTVEPIKETPTPSQKKPQSEKPVKLPSSNHLEPVKDTLTLPKKELQVKVTQPVVHHQIFPQALITQLLQK